MAGFKRFRNYDDFDAFLTKVTTNFSLHETAMLAAMGEFIKEDAKRKFGIYQPSVGPYNAWAPLAASTQQDRIRKNFQPDNPLYRTGDLMESVKVEVEGHKAVVGSEDPIMLWQENGTEVNGTQRIPPRPVLGPAAFESLPVLKRIGREMVRALFSLKQQPISKRIGERLR